MQLQRVRTAATRGAASACRYSARVLLKAAEVFAGKRKRSLSSTHVPLLVLADVCQRQVEQRFLFIFSEAGKLVSVPICQNFIFFHYATAVVSGLSLIAKKKKTAHRRRLPRTPTSAALCSWQCNPEFLLISEDRKTSYN